MTISNDFPLYRVTLNLTERSFLLEQAIHCVSKNYI